MAAYFFNANGTTHIISNTMSIYQAGFKACKSYYNQDGHTLTFYIHDNGAILAVMTRGRRRQSIKTFFRSKDEANAYFRLLNDGKTFQSGKWVPERKK